MHSQWSERKESHEIFMMGFLRTFVRREWCENHRTDIILFISFDELNKKETLHDKELKVFFLENLADETL